MCVCVERDKGVGGLEGVRVVKFGATKRSCLRFLKGFAIWIRKKDKKRESSAIFGDSSLE